MTEEVSTASHPTTTGRAGVTPTGDKIKVNEEQVWKVYGTTAPHTCGWQDCAHACVWGLMAQTCPGDTAVQGVKADPCPTRTSSPGDHYSGGGGKGPPRQCSCTA